jgi:superfamily II DNA or RNA helicase
MHGPDEPRTVLQIALAENARLLEENARLKKLVASRGLGPASDSKPSPQIPAPQPRLTDPEEKQRQAQLKIALFRHLFRGREDVYAVRWEARDGKSGYMPVSIQDWSALLRCDAAERKRVQRKTRKLLPLTDEAIRNHLTGKQTIGIYPLLHDDCCWFLAVDFDKASWQEDCIEFLRTCRALGVAAHLERSRSGNGAHVWIFFAEKTSAALARKLACTILTQTMERRPQLGLDSYDRLFPNQDTMPKGGFGNLIALPLQRAPRDQGNNVFVDDELRPFDDQWAFLSSVVKMSPVEAERIVNESLKHGGIIGVRLSVVGDTDEEDPWTLPPSKRRGERPISGPLPETIEIINGNLLFVPKQHLPPAMLNRLIRMAAFQNPEFYKAQAMRLPTYDKPRVISCAEDFPQYVGLPRGCFPELREFMAAHRIHINLREERVRGNPINVKFAGTLRAFQTDAFEKAANHEIGIICAPTAFGKTVLAARIIAERAVNTLIIVHRQQLLDQWRERLAIYLDLPVARIGQIGGGKERRTGEIDIALIQSLQRKGEVKDLVAEYGQVIVDECHHLSAFTFDQVMRRVKARYVLGLTATPVRKDGHHPIIYMQCGPIIYSLSPKKAIEDSGFEHVVSPRLTDFRPSQDLTDPGIQDLYAAITTDHARNSLIATDIVSAVNNGRTPLVLTGRTDHIDRIRALIADRVAHVFVLKGGMGKKQRAQAAADIETVLLGQPRVILATGSYIGEGFDDPRLDTLFLVMPISWRGTLQQYVGRLHRLHEGKRIVRVYDYVDANVPMLGRMFEKRLKGYNVIGYRIEPRTDLSNHAVSGT